MSPVVLADWLLEADKNSAKRFIMKYDDWEWYAHDFEKRMPPGFVRRKGKGYDQQWQMVYKNWLFVVSTYDDGSTIWSAFFKSRIDKWGGGGEPEKLPAGADLSAYVERLKKMADDNPDVWRKRHIPRMPLDSDQHYGY